MKPIQQFAKAIPLTVLVFTAQMLVADKSWAQNDLCGGFQSISLTDWEAGLGAWTVGTYDLAQPGAFDTPDWAAVGDLPDGRAGRAAFVANSDVGACPGDDQSGVLTLTSPSIEIPAETDTPKIALNHWFDIEYGWDGGNLKISVNEGDFTLVPGSAFETGPYTDVLFEAIRDLFPYNLNPLAEQEAFTGPGLDLEGGSWGVSRVNLAGIAGPGDSIQLRFDLGIDECFGAVGWYIDEVEVYSCEEAGGTRLTLVNDVINDNGGSAQASSWTLSAAGPTPISGSGPSVSSGENFAEGTYDLSESDGPAGYDSSDWVCVGGTQNDADTITLEQGDSATCTITHDDIAPVLKVLKNIVNDDGGRVTDPDAFGLRVNGEKVLHGVSNTFQAGNHLVSEDGLAGYQPGTWVGDCNPDGSITLTLGQEATCSITNDDTASTSLTLVKKVINDNGGTASASAWTLSADGPTPLNGSGPNVSSGEGFAEGTYDLSESGGPPGYSAGDWVCVGGSQPDADTINLAQGDSATCTITNDDIGGFQINSGISDNWFDPPTSGQGFFIIVWEDLQYIFLSWFTYEVERPPEGATAVVGEPGHRWLTALGPYDGDTATLDIHLSEGMIFDSEEPPVDAGPVGTMVITWTDCNSGLLVYDMPDSGVQGEIPIQRIVLDNVPACEAAQEQGSNALLANNHKVTEDSLEADQPATSLTLVRQLTNDQVDSTPASAWELNADGPTPLSGSGPIVSSIDGFAAGTYDLSVSNGPLGYSTGEWVCAGGSQLSVDSITLAQGDSATCIFTNDDIGNGFQINSGISDNWFDPPTSGQGFFIIVWEDLQQIFLSWFTYEVERPPEDATAVVGEPGHRWLTALGPYDGDTATLDIHLSEGMIFDSEEPPVDAGPVGTMVITWTGCNSGVLVYDLPESGRQGEIPIQRIVLDNVPACEAAQSPQE